MKEKTKIDEAITCGICKIEGQKVVLGVMDGNFLMGSMGSAVGEKIVLAAETSLKEKITSYFIFVYLVVQECKKE